MYIRFKVIAKLKDKADDKDTDRQTKKQYVPIIGFETYLKNWTHSLRVI